MRTKIKQSITAFLAVISSVFIILASIIQWVPRTYYQTAKEALYTMNLYSFLQNSPQFSHYIEKQDKEPANEKN